MRVHQIRHLRARFGAEGVVGLALWLVGNAASVHAAGPEVPEAVALPGWVTDWIDTCSGTGSTIGGPLARPSHSMPPAKAECAQWFLLREAIDLSERIDAGLPLRRELRRAQLQVSRYLVRWAPDDPRPRTFPISLTSEARLGALDLDGDGRFEPLVVEPGKVHRIETHGDEVGLVTLSLPTASSALAPLSPSSLLNSLVPDATLLAWPGVSRARFFRLRQGASGFDELSELPLPTMVDVRTSVFDLRSPALLRVERLDDTAASATFGTEPTVVAPGRWKVLLFSPGADSAADRVREAWLRTPEVERPIWSRLVSLQGKPLLITQSLRDDQVGVFERKKVRIYPLREDRTRAGSEPLFAEHTASRIWQELDVQVASAGRGRVRLTLLQRDGFDGKKTLVHRWEGPLERLSDSRSRRSVLKSEWTRWTPGHDLDGDGIDDLLLTSDRLALHRGLGSGRHPFDRTASWVAELPKARPTSFETALEIADEEASAELEFEAATESDSDEDGDLGQIDWGRARVVGRADRQNILLIGARGRAARGGTHLLLRLTPR